MPIAFRSASSNQYSAASSTATLPAGVAAGDFLILLNERSANETPTTPSGWTLVGTPTTASSLTLAVYVRLATGSDTGPLLQWTNAGRVSWLIAAYTGVDPTTPVDGISIVGYLSAAASSSHTVPSLTAGADDCIAFEIIGNKAATPETNIAAPAGVTRDAFYYNPNASSPNLAIGRANTDTDTGGTGGGHTWTSVQSSQRILATLLIRPAVTAEVKTTTGSLPLDVGLNGTATPVKATTAALPLNVGTVGQEVAVRRTTGTLPLGIDLLATSVPVRATTGSLPLAVAPAAATGAATRSTTGSLPLQIGLIGSATTAESSTTTGTLPLLAGLTATATPVKVTTGALPLTIGLEATSTATRSTTGALPLDVSLTGQAAATRTTTGALPLDLTLTADATPVMTTTGTLGLDVDLVGAGRALNPPKKIHLNVSARLRQRSTTIAGRDRVTTRTRHLVEVDL